MPLTSKGKKILGAMRSTYKNNKKAEEVFYASENAGKITGVHESVSPEQRGRFIESLRRRTKKK